MEFEERLKNLNNHLDETFVEGYEEVKNWMSHINAALSELHINFHYDSYDDFCVDYKTGCLDFAKKRNDIDLLDPKLVILWVPFVIRDIITQKYKSYGLSTEPLEVTQEEKDIKDYFISKVIGQVKESSTRKQLKDELVGLTDELENIDEQDKESVEKCRKKLEKLLKEKYGNVSIAKVDIIKLPSPEKPKKKRGRPPKKEG
jgi:hypothetical protein